MQSLLHWFTKKEEWKFTTHKRAYLIFTVVIPSIVLIFFLFFPTLEPDWQGAPNAYLALFITKPILFYFYHFLVYSMVCVVLLARNYQKYVRYLAVRLGVYTGTVFAAMYTVLGYYYIHEIPWLIIFALVVAAIVLMGYRIRRTLVAMGKVGILVFILLIIVLAMIVAGPFGSALLVVPVFALIACIFCGPVWAAFFGILLSIQLSRDGEKHASLLPKIFGIAGYSALYGTTLYLALERLVIEYSHLPATASDCYIVTAATKGHPRFVGSWEMQGEQGSTWKINKQLLRCKYLELWLKAIAPQLHASIRKRYDTLGPVIAKRISNPFLADLVYLCVKPIEWCGQLLRG